MKNILYILVLLLLPGYAFAEETLQQKIQNILNDKTIDDPYKNFRAANVILEENMIHLSFEEAMLLCNDILMPFVEKKVKDDHKRNTAKSLIYNDFFQIYEKRGAPGDYANMEASISKAVEFADLSGDNGTRALMYRNYGYVQSTIGNVQLAHEYFYKAIPLCEFINNYAGIFMCFFRIAENLSQTRDIAGLRKVIEQMQQYIEKPVFDGNPKCFYDFYTVQGTYYGILSEDNPEITAYNDSALMADRSIINLIENNREKMGDTPIAFAYYNMSVAYRNCYPQQYDSIYYFLDKALDLRIGKQFIDIELEINVYILYAEVLFAQKRYEQAEKDILYVLSLLDQIKDVNSVITEYTEAYKFLVMYYETMNRPVEALKYHKLLLENEKKRYNNDKIVAMDDMLVKYETEKKKEQIDRLTERNKTARKILMLTISLIVVLLIVLLFFIRFYKLRKKNLELSIYEVALLAELKHTELEQNQKEKEHLQQQYDNLKAQTGQNEQKALLYNAELKRIKQQLEQKPTKIMVGKLKNWILESHMEKIKKNTYIQQLSELDVDILERGYLTTSEKISSMDMKYIICFAIDMDVKDMSLLFNVEPASIRSVRYRIKKKFGEKNTFNFLI